MFEGFVHPALAFGTLLASVPLIIHLLNRQRYRPIQWAALQFVIAAYKKTRRRVQLENLLLLLLRMAAVALFALAVSRPFTSSDSPLSNLTESRRDVVMVLDGSASTGYRADVESVFEREVARARQIFQEDLDAARGDRVRLILAGGYPRLLSWTGPDKAAALLDTMTTPTDEPLDLEAALAEVCELAKEDAAGTGQSLLEVRILTDLQRRSFVPSASEDATAASESDEAETTSLSDQLDQLEELGVRVFVEDLGPADSTPPNLGVASITPLSPVLGPGIPFEISVEVRNYGTRAKSGLRVVVEVDGERRPNKLIDVPARGTAQAIFPMSFRTAGSHVVRATIEADRLALDDTLVEIIEVPAAVKVLGVNGAPNPDDIERDELGLLSAVLEPVRDDSSPAWMSTSPFEMYMVRSGDLADPNTELFDYDVIWLANVQSLPTSAVERLEKRVAAGATLVVSLGDNVNAQTYNTRLFRADGSGLMPAELGRLVSVATQRGNYYRVKSFDTEHPVLSFFAEESWRSLFTEVPVYQFMASKPLENAKILATLDDDGASPLMLERTYDRGRVVLWTTTIDPAWTMLPEIPRTLVPFVHELLRYAGSADLPPRNVTPGDSLVGEVSTSPRQLEVVPPDGTPRVLDGTAEAIAPNRWRLPAVPGKDTERAGLYRVRTDAESLSFAVQADPNEGDLDRLGALEVEGLHPALVLVNPGLEDDDSNNDPRPPRGELWRWLALTCLIVLIVESLFAAWIGHRRRLA